MLSNSSLTLKCVEGYWHKEKIVPSMSPEDCFKILKDLHHLSKLNQDCVILM